jgi:hypothetical protein
LPEEVGFLVGILDLVQNKFLGTNFRCGCRLNTRVSSEENNNVNWDHVDGSLVDGSLVDGWMMSDGWIPPRQRGTKRRKAKKII